VAATPDDKAVRPPLTEAVPEAPAGDAQTERRASSLIDWFREQDLLRGPHLFTDYWANVLLLGGMVPQRHLQEGWVDPALFRAGLDRPDFQVPRTGFYLLLFLLGPLLFLVRGFRAMGRYRLRVLGTIGQEVQRALQAYRLSLRPVGSGRVDAIMGDTTLASGIVDPDLVSGFCSMFWAAYKLPLATFSAILVVVIATPALSSAGLLGLVVDYWIPIGFPAIVVLLYLFYQEWLTAILGALPVLLGRYLLRFTQPATIDGWLSLVWPLLALLALYLIFDWFFMPRPVPPVLLLYTADGPGRAYERAGDAPYWLEGRVYWVWRYLILSPAELNKFWERDWERVDLWIRADGEDAGMLEWVVTDLHYRELWTPAEGLMPAESLARYRAQAKDSLVRQEPGTWLVEVDADLLVHYPYIRGMTFLPERGGVPARSVVDLIRALRHRIHHVPDPEDLVALDRMRLRFGRDVLGDVPEFMARRVSRHLMSQPWRYWRYPLGAATREEARLYGLEEPIVPPPAADPELQIKAL
jgi:hypothetical protein